MLNSISIVGKDNSALASNMNFKWILPNKTKQLEKEYCVVCMANAILPLRIFSQMFQIDKRMSHFMNNEYVFEHGPNDLYLSTSMIENSNLMVVEGIIQNLNSIQPLDFMRRDSIIKQE